ncbi:MAG: DUF2867 domain-containing protein [Pseudomonadota bacterium]
MSAGVFHDCYTGKLGSPHASPRALVAWGLAAMPGWVGGAMWLRNRVVAPFGLKTGAEDGVPADLMQRLPVLSDTPDEFVTGMEDRHLDFSVRLTKTSGGGFELATRVVPHNLFGRVYLRAVTPAHKMIMRRIARGLAQPIKEDP